MEEPEFAYYSTFNISNASICLKKHDNKLENLTENQKKLLFKATKNNVEAQGVGIQTLKVFDKYLITPLGDKIKIKEKQKRQDICLKTSKKHGL